MGALAEGGAEVLPVEGEDLRILVGEADGRLGIDLPEEVAAIGSPLPPLPEGLTAAAFGAFVWRYGVSLQTLEYLIFTLILLAVALVDWDTGFIPDGLLLAGILDFVVLPLLRGEGAAALGRGLLAGAVLAVPLLLIVLVMDRVLGRESMGGGDIKLFFTVGLFGSLRTDLLVVLLACVIGIGLALLPQKTAHEGEPSGAIPFGPAISAAAVLSLLWGEPFVAAYLNLFV